MAPFRLFDPELLELAEEQREHNVGLMKVTEAMAGIDNSTPEGIRWIRDAMEPGGLFGFQALDFPEDRTIPGDIPIRVYTPETVKGVYLHFHGGGMTVGSARGMDLRNWRWAQALDCAVVSVDYRLAPEHPYPAGPDDCEAAALWLIEHAAEEFGTDKLVTGGESAGAYFTMVTLLRLRDRLGATPPFLGADLCYGGYDMSGTPSTELQVGKVPYATGGHAQRAMYLPDRDLAQLRDPAVSPMWAELHDLPPAILTVGTADWLLDESILLGGRLAAAGNEVELAVYPEGPHGVESMPTELGRRAAARIFEFLRSKIEAAP
jgi:acetyl esterase/lipase